MPLESLVTLASLLSLLQKSIVTIERFLGLVQVAIQRMCKIQDQQAILFIHTHWCILNISLQSVLRPSTFKGETKNWAICCICFWNRQLFPVVRSRNMAGTCLNLGLSLYHAPITYDSHGFLLDPVFVSLLVCLMTIFWPWAEKQASLSFLPRSLLWRWISLNRHGRAATFGFLFTYTSDRTKWLMNVV